MKAGFLGFEIDTDRQELSGPDGVVSVEPQVFQLLYLLIENRERVVSKDELIEKIWDGRFVSDAAVTSRINLLRTALGDSGTKQAVIKTYPKRGYRFVADISHKPMVVSPLSAIALQTDTKPTRSSPGVVVLPFRDLSAATEKDFLAEGITEEITVALSRCSDVAVIANRSAMAVQDVAAHISDVGRTLSAKYVVKGTVQRAADRVRVTAQTIEAESGKYLWADRFEGAIDEIFEIQDKVARSIAAVLPTRIQGTQFQQNLSGRAQNLSSYEAYLRAIWTLRRNGDLFQAIHALEELLKEDRDYALAHAQVAVFLGFSPFVSGRDDPEITVRSVAHIRRALTFESADERVLTKAGLVFLDAGDFGRALRYSSQALELNPHSVEAIHFRGCVLNATGDYEAALECQRAAMQLDPLFPEHYYENVIEANYLLGRYREAIAVYENWGQPHRHMSATMAACYAMAGDERQAQKLAAEFIETRPKGFRVADFISAVMRYHALEKDKAHWRNGYALAGLLADAPDT